MCLIVDKIILGSLFLLVRILKSWLLFFNSSGQILLDTGHDICISLCVVILNGPLQNLAWLNGS